MGREFRTIVLDGEESKSALANYLRTRRDTQVHDRNIAEISLAEGPEVTGVVILVEPLLNGRDKIDLSQEDIVEAIVAFLQEKAHPLPRRGRKSLTWIKGDLAMLVELDWF
ncbi:MAG: hypothetical protein R3245_03340 [Kiloniellales bacterium]|nr:hypothetical protein [Kiloniellales bacterium]